LIQFLSISPDPPLAAKGLKEVEEEETEDAEEVKGEKKERHVRRRTYPLDSLVIRFSPHYLPNHLPRSKRMIYPNIIHPK
jgi:hypothetical protein